MKKELGILLLALLATVGFSGAVAAQPFAPGYAGGPYYGPGFHHGGTTVIIINRHRHFFPPWWWYRHRFYHPFFPHRYY